MHPLFACRVAKLGAEEATHPNLHQHQQQNSPPHPPWAPPGPNTTHQNLQEVRCGGEWVWTHMSVVKPQGMCGGQAGETGYASHGPPSQSAQACAVLLLLLCGCLGWYFVCACVRAGMYTHRVGAHMYTYSTHTHFSTRHKRARYVRIYAYRYLTHTHTLTAHYNSHIVWACLHILYTHTHAGTRHGRLQQRVTQAHHACRRRCRVLMCYAIPQPGQASPHQQQQHQEPGVCAHGDARACTCLCVVLNVCLCARMRAHAVAAVLGLIAID